jgi:hypothetical protein
MNIRKIALILIITMASTAAIGSEFCAGFEMGYKTIKGNNVIVPICPIAPITPIGSTPYQEGIKKGMEKARTGY